MKGKQMRTPNTVTYSGKALEEMKKNGAVAPSVLENIRKTADEYLDLPILSVIYRKAVPPTKNPHEYASLAPYWWPNPDTPDGLPYVRRDGHINPDYYDDMTFERMADAVHVLSLAAYYFEEEKYAKRAEKLLYDWFLNPETYMEPHAEYAQYIPGVCDGRGIGLIEFRFAYNIFNSVRILESIDLISEKTVRGVEKWFYDFANWMLTGDKGQDEDIQKNNHGTWYDVTLLTTAIFTKREFLAKKIASTAYVRRVRNHIKEDGTQPLELQRTKGIHYTLFNVWGMAIIGNIADKLGYKEFWENDEVRGKNLIKSAVDFIYPYLLSPETFPYEEIFSEPIDEDEARVLTFMSEHFEEYKEKAKLFVNKPYTWLAEPNI